MAGTKHLTPEEEFFAQESLVKTKKLHTEKHNKLAAEEKEKLKKLHWMRCPKDGSELHEILFRGITIDRCFTCNGVFLAAKEFEKIAGKESSLFPSILSLFKYSP
jgi:hypothetical protein